MTGANGLTDLVMSAEYLKRGGHYDAEDKLAKRWEWEDIQRPDSPDEDALDRHELLKSSSHDHAFMHQCKIIEARSGIDAGVPEPQTPQMQKGQTIGGNYEQRIRPLLFGRKALWGRLHPGSDRRMVHGRD